MSVRRPKNVKIDSNLAKAYVQSNFNNTRITITNLKGDVICQSSAGCEGFSGSKKSTTFAAIKIANKIAEKALQFGITGLEVFKSGIGPGADTAVKALNTSGLSINAIHDITPVPHNGCRPPKERRG